MEESSIGMEHSGGGGGRGRSYKEKGVFPSMC